LLVESNLTWFAKANLTLGGGSQNPLRVGDQRFNVRSPRKELGDHLRGSPADTAKRHTAFADENIPSRRLAPGNSPLNARAAEH